MLSVACQGNISLHLSIGRFKPNVFIILLGDSTKYRKSTSVNKGEDILERIDGINFLPSRFSTEGLIESISKMPVGGIIRDEYAGFLLEAKKQYMADIKDFLCELYDGKSSDRQLRKTTFSIKKPCISFLSSTTPFNLAQQIELNDFLSGYLARHLLIYPEKVNSRMKISMFGGSSVEQRDRIIDTLSYIKNKFIRPVNAYFDDETLVALDKFFEKNERDEEIDQRGEELSAFYGRLNDYVIKLAILFEISKKSSVIETVDVEGVTRYHLKVRKESLLQSISFVERYKKLYLPKIAATLSFQEAERIISILKEYPNGMEYWVLLRRVRTLSTEDLKKVLYTLIDQNKIKDVNLMRKGAKVQLTEQFRNEIIKP